MLHQRSITQSLLSLYQVSTFCSKHNCAAIGMQTYMVYFKASLSAAQALRDISLLSQDIRLQYVKQCGFCRIMHLYNVTSLGSSSTQDIKLNRHIFHSSGNSECDLTQCSPNLLHTYKLPHVPHPKKDYLLVF